MLIWNLKRRVIFLHLGSKFFLVEFVDIEKIERVLRMGVQRFKDKAFSLEKRRLKVGCFRVGVQANQC